jgi:hypothetical protein
MPCPSQYSLMRGVVHSKKSEKSEKIQNIQNRQKSIKSSKNHKKFQKIQQFWEECIEQFSAQIVFLFIKSSYTKKKIPKNPKQSGKSA